MPLVSRILIWLSVVVTAVCVLWFLAALVLGRAHVLDFLLGAPPEESVSFETLVPPATPNSYLVCPPGLCRAAPMAVPSPVFAIPADRLRADWTAMLARQPRVTVLGGNPHLRQMNIVQRSRVIGFPDRVTVRFIPLGQELSTLAIYSRSLYGRSDFGVNRARVKRWLAGLPRPLPSRESRSEGDRSGHVRSPEVRAPGVGSSGARLGGPYSGDAYVGEGVTGRQGRLPPA